MSEVKVGDIVRVQVNIYGSIEFAEFELEEFHHCLGFFKSKTARLAHNFTPLCSLIEPVTGSDEYVCNFGTVHTEYNKIYDIYKPESVKDSWVSDYDGDLSCFI